MHFKREISTSSVNTVSDSIKRLAISHDGHPERVQMTNDHQTTTNVQQRVETQHPPIVTVMSNAKDDFISRYEVIREIGKGGFSIVYQCRHRVTLVDYAVKV
jgi:serine/threonine protein kinase